MSGVTVSSDGVVTGNTYDKYGSGNPVVRRLMRGFESSADELLALAAPDSLLDVGCGEGVLLARWAQQLPQAVDHASPALACCSPRRSLPQVISGGCCIRVGQSAHISSAFVLTRIMFAPALCGGGHLHHDRPGRGRSPAEVSP